MHSHSKFATSKLASMVVARILNSEDKSIQPQETRNIEKKLPQQLSFSPYIFRRYMLTNIEIVTRSNAETPVKKLIFQVIHPNDRLSKFLPGDYIEIMSYVNNHVIVRPYTPLQEPSENSFSILVKIYKDGVMTQHLDKQLRNFEVKVRGPFDIANRITYSSASSPALESNSIARPSSVNSHTRTFSNNSKGLYKDYMKRSNSIDNNQRNFILNSIFGERSGILLNKERDDLCWDCLFMVCGGTGITPMLQLVSYIKLLIQFFIRPGKKKI
ncbi:hypothetical protein C1645_767831 [Glomus cerebriforme]|uniref:FAD-binding FR-type domain-containing protein n=1 Tax=Glomus cerebriforme TaxID=658196 RepID=A0A397SYX9_9GLOM|nr:hypothetical protein C1645_767831 [Glomus cerebriforme]